jgi:FSR family fosmidomycin resistance protein-like MFS transporter
MIPRQRLFWSVSLGHTIIDMFNGIGPVLLTFLSGHLMPLTNTQIGFAISAYQLVGALSQPFFGYQADKTGGRLLGAGGLAWTASLLMISVLMATTGQYLLMVVPFVLAALGSGAFHPVGSLHAADADHKRSTRNLSIFFFMGQAGNGIGPALIGLLLDRAATNNSLFTERLGPAFSGILIEHGTVSPVLAMILFAIPGILMMAFWMPGMRAYTQHRQTRQTTSTRTQSTFASRALWMLVLVVTLRSLANPGSIAFLPRLFALKGWSASEYGLITSAFWLAGGIAGIVAGQVAERYGSRNVISVTLVLSAIPLFLLALVDGPAAFLLALAAGGLTGASHSLIVVMAQGLMPAQKGFASGATLGFIFGTGAIGTLVIGALSDRLTLPVAFQVIGVVTFVTGFLALGLPSEQRAPEVQPSSDLLDDVIEPAADAAT